MFQDESFDEYLENKDLQDMSQNVRDTHHLRHHNEYSIGHYNEHHIGHPNGHHSYQSIGSHFCPNFDEIEGFEDQGPPSPDTLSDDPSGPPLSPGGSSTGGSSNGQVSVCGYKVVLWTLRQVLNIIIFK